MTKIIAVSTNKGGVLKSSITTNLAGVLSKAGDSVLVIDTDNQANATLTFGIEPDELNYTLYDVLVDGLEPQFVIKEAYKNIDLLPANDDMAFFDLDVLTQREKYPDPFRILRRSMEPIREKYDYILIDTPPNIGLVHGNVLTFADEILIPFQPEPYSMRSLVKMLKSIDSFKRSHNPYLNVLGVVGTLIDYRTSLHSEIMQKCRAYCDGLDIYVFEAEIPRLIRYAESVVNHGLPATLSSKKEEQVEPYYKLKGELLEWQEKIMRV